MLRFLVRFAPLALLFALLIVPAVASAHEHRDVGTYEFVVGFKNEPAFENEQNGIWVEITDKASGAPVENLAETLKAQVIFGSQTRDMTLKPAWGEKGVYISDFYPTAAGDYTFRFFGDINGTPIDEKFTSAPDGFNSVQPVTELQFPTKIASASEMSTQLAAAQRTAQIAMGLGVAGLGLGTLGLILGALAFRRRGGATPQREQSVART